MSAMSRFRPADINAQYSLAAPESVANKITTRQRRKMFARFVETMDISADDTLLDVGATTDTLCDHSNYLEAWWAHKHRITAVGIDDCGFLETLYPGMRFVQADGCDLPFPDGSFDFVHSSAVIEHVGDRARQARLLGELWRVARRGVFVTTPNRWFPVEVHTMIPLLHWLPPRWYRAILRRVGLPLFAEEANLNLLSRSDLAGLVRAAGIADFRIAAVDLLALPSNLILMARKDAASRACKAANAEMTLRPTR
jgi:SAM-dependent methyltransferase